MKNTWLVVGALCLGGCSSSSDSTPETTAAVSPSTAVQPQVVATVAPPVVQAPTPQAPSSPSPIVQSPSQTVNGEQSQRTDDTKRQQVESLRLGIRSLQSQRAFAEQKKAQFRSRRPNADPNERATGATFPDDRIMALHNQELDSIDSQIASKQRQIDDLMMSR